ncbi:MAG: DEAD/DEAH box helicase family protein [Chloroflexi bacterium]|nr:DEAD/DEAH box helicase family protein [Chloroflexota bacterium]
MDIEKYLVLNKYLLSLFGVSEFKDGLQSKLKGASPGVDGDGRSHFVNVLRSSLEGLKIREEALLRYDANIQSWVGRINYRREPVSLKYFQYLAVLFAEIVLDNLKNRRVEFVGELNQFLEEYRRRQPFGPLDSFTEADLKKLAFWMATGSGKTLISHINYHQFFHYKLFSPDNIIFITPNEGLSRQHFEELQKSGIPARLYAGSLSRGGKAPEGEILIIEMTKLVEEKKGSGVTVPVGEFEGKNLLFVDEGHKGKRSEEQKWARLRNTLAENGFVFEYSATFGQILTEKNEETLREYAKSIVFDYSYKYFYLDGYGKDFSVLNVKQAKVSDQEFQETMFAANLLSFYEQLLVYGEKQKLAREHNLEKPLWVFVGTTVTGKEQESDVVQIVDFLRRVIQDEEWTRGRANDILGGKASLKDAEGKDLFSGSYYYLRKRGIDIGDLYRRVFGGGGTLHVRELKRADGELGLKVGENDYFGVINIGDVPGFKKELEKRGMAVSQDAMHDSLFDDIKKENCGTNVLVGAKKFIEGWDTWRVSCMGLLNIGAGQGPQIIQLFGRGVRLKGKDMSLKRSDVETEVRTLETLNICGLRADYLDRFLEAIRKEEVEFETIDIPVKAQHQDKWKSLTTLCRNESKKFEEETVLRLALDSTIWFKVDLRPAVSAYRSERQRGSSPATGQGAGHGLKSEVVKAEVEPVRFPEDAIELLDWDRIAMEVADFKAMNQYWNLVTDSQGLKDILQSDRYELLASPEAFEVKGGDRISRLEDIALLIMRKYLGLFYSKQARRFDTENVGYVTVAKQLPLFAFERPDKKHAYSVQVEKSDTALIKEIRELARDLKRLHKEDRETLPRIHFDQHLYVPILLQGKKIDRISPAGLVESEGKFVSGLKQYLKLNAASFSDTEIYLLRNIPQSGVGFQLKWHGFYPDFIMWLKKGRNQTVLFVDPKGLEHEKELDTEKIQFKNGIKEMELRLGRKNVRLESYILSDTRHQQLADGRKDAPSKDKYIEDHVLFLEDANWPEQLLAV